MKLPKNQSELLQLLVEQNKQLEEQSKQIKTLKMALLRLDDKVRKVGILAERVQGNTNQLKQRVQLTEDKLIKR